MGYVLKKFRHRTALSFPAKLEIIRKSLLSNMGPKKAILEYFAAHGLPTPKNPTSRLHSYRNELKRRLDAGDKEALRLAEAYDLIEGKELPDDGKLSSDDVVSSEIHDSL